jgi:hypothetical protein
VSAARLSDPSTDAEPAPLVRALETALAPSGLDLIGVAEAHDYDLRVDRAHSLAVLAPWARSVVMIANGGGALWRSVQDWAEHRGGLAAVADPIDEFTEETIRERAAPVLARAGCRHEIAFPFLGRDGASALSFLDLGAAAGIGSPSLLRVLVHPVFGPWIALRAAILTDAELHAARPADGFDPCPTCAERACIAACPAGAVTSPDGWNFVACIDHRIERGSCEERCEARFDCVIGREHRYPASALAHHHGRAWRAMRAWREGQKGG